MIFLIQHFCLEFQTSVFQLAKTVVVERINGSCIEDFFSQFVVFLPVFIVIHAGLYIAAFKKFLDKHIIASDRDSLIQVVKVIVVIGESHRQSLDNECRQIFTVSSPLFFCIAFHQFFVNIFSYQTDGLLFQVFRFPLYAGFLFLYNSLCFCRSADIPHFAESIHIKRHVVHFSMEICHRRIGITVKFHQGVHKLPYFTVAGVKNMSSILMHMNAFHIFTVQISTYSISLFDHQTFFSCLYRMIGKDP